jgi:hypothetical protein
MVFQDTRKAGIPETYLGWVRLNCPQGQVLEMDQAESAALAEP